ncbi:peroxiredoxin [Salmonella enterica]|uniref:Peroxiredoxin n=5 Tax=Salmonella enterica TaxID=28901 RepID=A0A702LN20_SALHO|nr:peroxiredoxin [Salmonella enterica subsp. houtenae]EAA7389396.1 peroxiredoxin [Salmonella enterica subsp. enterica]EAA9526289.1 peroxiredoxin [Salmonella enterica]EBH8100069.1 peroxiredoxin [Salmonella enterica subsp. houtenae serovar O:11:g,z25:-]ECG1392589.1 peroxiredoxin [Salmonella enterica subsp. houtenae str. CFSAN000557]ECT3982352.1 peroxiredoxin [Salmonella enterica subsp. houtenae serovar 53:z4,z23:-]EDR5668013.1 peroxiredoxin [Salmonella enterica subsp. houtenae serovar 50:z4,z23
MIPILTQNYISLGQEHAVTFGNTPLTLKPGILAEGKMLPCTKGLVRHDLLPGYCIPGIKKRIIVVPSLDTPVCEWQVKEYSDRLKSAGSYSNRAVYVLSMDTPFAQVRFIRDHDIHPGIVFVSDYACHQFLDNSGLKINELSIFARALIECDENNVVTRVIVPRDITHIPVC